MPIAQPTGTGNALTAPAQTYQPRPPKKKSYSVASEQLVKSLALQQNGYEQLQGKDRNKTDSMALILNEFLAPTPLAGTGRIFTRAARRFETDPRLLVAIAGAESEYGKHESGAFNPFGWGPGIDFRSHKQAINKVTKGLSEGYIKQGLTSIPAIAGKWAPVGASNDPTDLNLNWVGNVSANYRDIANTKRRKQIPGMTELIHDPIGSWFDGQFTPGVYGGHPRHVHLAATNPRLMLKAIRVADRMGLSARENPYVDPVDPVHTEGSYHGRNFPGKFKGKVLGQAVDVSGDAEKMAAYFNKFMARAGGGVPGYTGHAPTDTYLAQAGGTVAGGEAARAPTDAMLASIPAAPLLDQRWADQVATSFRGRGRRKGEDEEDQLMQLLAALQTQQTGRARQSPINAWRGAY